MVDYITVPGGNELPLEEGRTKVNLTPMKYKLGRFEAACLKIRATHSGTYGKFRIRPTGPNIWVLLSVSDSDVTHLVCSKCL